MEESKPKQDSQFWLNPSSIYVRNQNQDTSFHKKNKDSNWNLFIYFKNQTWNPNSWFY